MFIEIDADKTLYRWFNLSVQIVILTVKYFLMSHFTICCISHFLISRNNVIFQFHTANNYCYCFEMHFFSII